MPDGLDELLSDVPAAPRGKITRRLPDLISFAKENKLTVGSTTGGRHNTGSKHYSGNAIDIKGSGGFDDARVNALKQAASERGFLVRDERRKPAGQKVWGGPHLHIEAAGAPKSDPLDALLFDVPDVPKESNPLDAIIADAPPVDTPTPITRVASRWGTNAPPQNRGRRRQTSDVAAQAQAAMDAVTGVVRDRPVITGGANALRPSTGAGNLRRLDQPETERIIRMQRQVANEPDRRTNARLLEGSLSDPEEAARRASEEQAAEIAAKEQDARYARDKPEIDRLAKEYRKAIRTSGQAGQAVAPITPSNWASEAIAKGGSGLAETLAGIVRTSKYNPLARGAENAADAVNIHAQAMHQAAMEEGASRTEASKFVQDIAGGFIGSSPEMAAMAVGVPGPIAFAVGGGTRAYGTRKPVLPAVAHGAATGAAFEVPVGGAGVRGAIKKAGAVGAGTGAIELASGATPREAAVTGLTNAAMVAGPKLLTRGGRSERQAEAQRQSVQAEQLAAAQRPVEADQGVARGSGEPSQTVGDVRADVVKRILRHQRDSLDGAEIIENKGATLIVKKADGTLSEVQNPRTTGNREAAIVKVPAEVVAEPLPAEGTQVPPQPELVNEAQTSRDVPLETRKVDAPLSREEKPRSPAAESVLSQALDPYGANTHQVAQAVLATPKWRERVLEELGEGAEPLENTGGAPTWRTANGDIVKVSNAYGSEKEPTLGTRHDGIVIEREKGVAPKLEPVESPRVSPEVPVNDPLCLNEKPAIAGQSTVSPEATSGSPLRSSEAAEVKSELGREGQKDATVNQTEAQKSIQTNEQPAGSGEATITPEPNKSTTSARQEQMTADRAELDLPELPAAERKGWQKTLDEAKAKGTQNAGVLADEVLAKPRALNDVETGQLVLRAQEIKNDHSRVMKEIGDATDPDVISAKRSQADALEGEFDKLTRATKASGSEKGRALASQKLTINQDFDLVSVLQRAKAKKGAELTGEERAKFEAMTKRVESLEAKLVEANEKLAQKAIQREIDKMGRQRKRGETRAVLDDEFADLRTQFALARKEITGVQASGLAGLDPEGKLTVLIAKMARNRVRAGITDAAAVVDEVFSVVKDHVEGITTRDVRDAISGYGLSGKDRRSDLEKKVAQLKRELQTVSKDEDIEAGKLAPRREGPRRSEASQSGQPIQGPKRGDINRVPMQGPRLSDAARSGKPLEGPKLSDANKLKAEGPKITDAPKVGPKANNIRENITKQIEEYERKLREKDYAEEPKRGAPIYDRETSNLKAQLEGLKRQVESEIRGKDSKLEVALAIRKAGLLTGIKTTGRNLLGTGANQPFGEVAKVPAVIADLVVSGTKYAATGEGRRTVGAPNLVHVAKASYEAATKGITEAIQIMKYGASAEDLAKLERPREVNSGSKLIDTYVNTVFRFMSAQDRVFKTYAFKRSILEQSKLRAKSEGKTAKELEQNPTADMVSQAILDAEVATFNNENVAAKGFQYVRQHSGVVGSTAIDLIVPFAKTPSNVMARLLESTPLGLAKGAGQLGKAAFKKEFSREDQRKFAQTIGRSVTGSGLIYLGYALADKGLATGLYEQDRGDNETQKAAGQPSMAVKVGGAWHQIGAFSPIGNLIGIGAALHREQHRVLKEGEEPTSLAAASVPITARTVLEQPMLQGMSGLVDAIKEPGSRGSKLIGRTVGSFVPTIVADTGAAIDNKRRDSRGMVNSVLSRIPIVRGRLPEDIDVFGRPLESRRTSMVDPTLTSTAKDDPFIKELIRLDVGIVKSNKKDGETDEQHRARIIAQGQEMAKQLALLVEQRGYQSKSDADKREAIKDKVAEVKKAVTEYIKTGGGRQRPERQQRTRERPYRYAPPPQ